MSRVPLLKVMETCPSIPFCMEVCPCWVANVTVVVVGGVAVRRPVSRLRLVLPKEVGRCWSRAQGNPEVGLDIFGVLMGGALAVWETYLRV